MAGSLAGALDETLAIFANPGATGFLREWQWSANYTEWIADIYNVSLMYGRQFRVRTPWSDRINFALGMHYQGVREFDSSRGAAPPVSARDVLISASIGSPITALSRNLSVGVNFKYLRSELAQFDANAFVFDLGVLYRTPRFRLSRSGAGLFDYGIFSFGLAVTQLGHSINFISTDTPLPRTLRAGTALNLGSQDGLQIQLAGEYRKVRDEISQFSFGAEITNLFTPLSQNLGRLIAVRGGYNVNDNLLSKLSFGLSIHLDDYMEPSAPRNTALRFDLGVREGNEFFSPVFRGSATQYSIRPERFEFAQPLFQSYVSTDTITLAWAATSDPDLYDEVDYLLLVVKDDSTALDQIIKKSEKDKFDIFKFKRTPFLTHHTDSTQINFLYLLANQYSSKNGAESFELQKNLYIIVNYDSTFFLDKKRARLSVTMPSPVEPGDYFWTAVAYDRNRHLRYVTSSGRNIAHFHVKTETFRPDLTIEIKTKIDTLFEPDLGEALESLGNVHFELNSDRLTMESESVLKKWVDLINLFPEVTFEITGHTDATGSEETNLKLSQLRAEAVKRFLIKQGIHSKCLLARGYGATKPVDKRNTKEALAKNRRVELKPVKYYLGQKTQCLTYVTYTNLGERTAENFSVTVYNSTVYDSSEFQPKLLPELLTSKQPISPDTMQIERCFIIDTTITKLEPGESDSIKVEWDIARPYMIALIDKENFVDEEDEFNNRDIASPSLPDLMVSHKVSEFIVQGGDTVKYHITITNNGLGPAKDFTLLDMLPDSLATFNFNIRPDSSKNSTLIWNFDSLAVGDSITISFNSQIGDIPLNQTVTFCNKTWLNAPCDVVPDNNVSSSTMYASMINFDFNKATLKEESKAVLKELAKNLKELLKENPEKMFEIAGHASLEPWVKPERIPLQKIVNLKLSQQRANSVKNFLVQQGVDCWRLIAIGYGHERPKYDNNDEMGLIKNRRVEIKPFLKINTKLNDCD